MKYTDKVEMKEKAIKLYLENKTYSEVAKILGVSRDYITNLIKYDERIINKNNNKIIKVGKYKGKKGVQIGITLLNEIGINNNPEIDEYVEIAVDKDNDQITVKKHKI